MRIIKHTFYLDRLHEFESREIRARIDTPGVKAVLSMGCDRDLVLKVLEKRLKTTGNACSKINSTGKLEYNSFYIKF